MNIKESVRPIKRYEALDSFRGLAAIGVLMYHVHTSDGISNLSFFRGSSLFVEFFFILSGFVMCYAYWDKKVTLKRFFIARFWRIYPLHLFTLGVLLVFESFKLIASYNGFDFNISPFSGRNSLWELGGNLLLLQSWLPFFDSLSFNSPSWSISIEFYLYLIFFLTFYTKRKYYLILSLFFFGLLSLNYDYLSTGISKGIYCFFLGVILCGVAKNLVFNFNNYYFWSLIEVLFIFLTIFLVSNKDNVEYMDIFIPLFFSALILTFSFERGGVSKLLRTDFFKMLGKNSYSIYLVHYIVIYFSLSFVLIISKLTNLDLTVMVGENRTISTGSLLYDNFYILFILISTLLLSKFTYQYVELRFMKKNRKQL
jgi:peptidoglycan/LPS O-acetylase OafA/YrhL